jgi:hypothetical protein
MDKHLIKTWLVNKKPKVYSVIVACYIEKLTMLQTALFIEWLSLELDVPSTLINKSSISSALRRYRNKNRMDTVGNSSSKQTRSSRKPFDTSVPDQLKFD